MSTRIALLGAGSLGTITGALIAQQGYDITLFDTNEAHVAALNEHGARLSGYLDATIPVVARRLDEAEGWFDIVILLTKQVFTAAALEPMLPLLREGSVVVTLQNGTPEDTVAAIVGRERTLAGNVYFAATWIAPGESALGTLLERTREHAFDLGELDGARTERLSEIAGILSAVGGVEITDNISGSKWSKLLINSTFSGLSAACGCTFGRVLEDEVTSDASLLVMDEAIRAGLAHGLDVEGIGGHPVGDLLDDGPLSAQERKDFFTSYIGTSAVAEASMLQDLRKGIPCEKDHIPGRVVSVAREHGLAAPVSELLYQLIDEAEAQGRVPLFEESRARIARLLAELRSA